MRKLLSVIALGILIGGMSGCRVAECWRYAWNSRGSTRNNSSNRRRWSSVSPALSTNAARAQRVSCGSPCATTTVTTPVPAPGR